MPESQEQAQDTHRSKEAKRLKITEKAQRIVRLMDVPAGDIGDLFDSLVFLNNLMACVVGLGLEPIPAARVAQPNGFFLAGVPARIWRLICGVFLVFPFFLLVVASPPVPGGGAFSPQNHATPQSQERPN